MHMPVRAVRVQGVEHSPNPTPNPKQGVEHMVIGTSEDRPGIRNGHALRSFLMDAFRFALSETLEHAWARAHPERSPAPPGGGGPGGGAAAHATAGHGAGGHGGRRASALALRSSLPRLITG